MLTEKQKEALDLLQKHPYGVRPDQFMAVWVSKSSIIKNLKALNKEGYITFDNDSWRWKITNDGIKVIIY